MGGEHEARSRPPAAGAARDEGLLIVAPDGKIVHVDQPYAAAWGLDRCALSVGKAATLRVLVQDRTNEQLGAVQAPGTVDRRVHRLRDGRSVERTVTKLAGTDMHGYEVERVRDIPAAPEVSPGAGDRGPGTTEALEHAIAVRDAIFAAMPDGILICDDGGHITRVNTRAEVMFGHDPEELVGKPIDHLLPRRPRSAHLDQRSEHARDTRPRPPGQDRRSTAIKKDGTELPVEVALGQPGVPGAALLYIVRDISERVRAEEALLAAQEQLRHALKMDAIGRLAGGVAHDFNNLLTVILSCADLILEALDTGHPARDDASEIHLAAMRAADLTRRLLAISRRQILQPKIVDPVTVVTGMHNLLGRLIGEHITFETRFSPVRSIRIDPGQLELVIMNLAINARDAMPDGGTLTIELREVELDDEEIDRVDLEPGWYVQISVSDTGEGIDAETLPKIFEPFFTTKEPGKGTGLGLSTVFGILRQSGGTIAARSRPGAGTTFDLILPVAEREPSAIPAAPSGVLRGGDETILLVEDDDSLRKLLSSVLSKTGYAVISARSALEALSLMERPGKPVSLLITDVIMPGMSGKHLAKRARSRCPEIRILFISGYASDMTEDDLADLGAAFLSKPITARLFARRVREVLDA